MQKKKKETENQIERVKEEGGGGWERGLVRKTGQSFRICFWYRCVSEESQLELFDIVKSNAGANVMLTASLERRQDLKNLKVSGQSSSFWSQRTGASQKICIVHFYYM